MNEQDVERRLAQLGKSDPRVTPEAVDAAICGKVFSTLPGNITICTLTLYNGLRVVGVNLGPVSAGNADPLIGEELSFKDARSKVWPILGAILAENLYRDVFCSAIEGRLITAEAALSALGYAYSHDAADYQQLVDPDMVAEIPVAQVEGYPVEQGEPAQEPAGKPKSKRKTKNVDKSVDESEA